MKKIEKLWIIKESTVHARGLFARQNIVKGTKIIEYVGKKLKN